MNNYPEFSDRYEASITFADLKENCKYTSEKGCCKAANFGGVCKKENCPIIRTRNSKNNDGTRY